MMKNRDEFVAFAKRVTSVEAELMNAKDQLKKRRSEAWKKMWRDIYKLYGFAREAGAKKNYYLQTKYTEKIYGRRIFISINPTLCSLDEEAVFLDLIASRIFEMDEHNIDIVADVVDNWETLYPRIESDFWDKFEWEFEERLGIAQEELKSVNEALTRKGEPNESKSN